MNIKFSINGQKISILERPTTISYTNELEAEFSFSNEWAGRQKTAIFKRTGINAIPVLIENDKCIVPKEVLRNCSKFEVGVIAGNIHTTNIVEVYIDRTCYNEDAEIPDPTPSIYDQIIEKLESIIKGGEGGEGGIGPQGPQGPEGPQGPQGPEGPKGDDGKSAYQIAVDNGYVGTEPEWLATLKGDKGDTGDQGPKGDKGDKGADGTMTFADLTDEQKESLRGPQGIQGPKGDTGEQGPQGIQGEQGQAGVDGKSLEFNWDATRLGVRKEGETDYVYVDLKGKDGASGTGADVDVATTDKAGIVKPDGTSTTVDADGTIHANAQISAGEIKTQVETYMKANPVSATVGDGSIEYKHINRDLRKYTIGMSLSLDDIKTFDYGLANPTDPVSSWNTMIHTEPISLEYFELKDVYLKGYNSRQVMYSVDENMNKLGQVAGTNSPTTMENISIPDGTKYLIFSFVPDDKNRILFKLKKEVFDLFDKGEYFVSKDTLSVSEMEAKEYIYSGLDADDMYRMEYKDSTVMKTSKKLPVNFDLLTFKITGAINRYSAIFFDSRDIPVRGVKYAGGKDELVSLMPPENACYYKIAVASSIADDVELTKYLRKDKITSIFEDYRKICDSKEVDYSKYRFLKNVVGKNKKVLCIGDSITFGACSGVNGADDATGVNPYGKYLAENTGWTVTIDGVGGIRTTGVWNNIKGGKPTKWGNDPYDIIILYLGVNYGFGGNMMTDPTINLPNVPTDAPLEVTGDEYDKAYLNIIWQLRQWYPNATLMCVTIQKFITSNGINYAREYDRQLALLNLMGVDCIADLRHYPLAHPVYDNIFRADDRCHYTNVGYAMLAEYFENELYKYYYEHIDKVTVPYK